MNKIAMVTGATAGIGEATAHRLAKEGYDLVITGRRTDRLDSLKEKLQSQYNNTTRCLNFDVRNQEEVRSAIAELKQQIGQIHLLVNNAGLASGLGLIQDGDTGDWDKMIDTNVKGLLYVSEAVFPMLIDGESHIINIGSTAGKEVYRNGGVYCATKYAVNAISQSMRIDLLPRGIRVTQICPGAAETEFSIVRFHGDKEKAKSVYDGYRPLSADDVAEVIAYAANLPKHMCINDLVLTSTPQANSHYIERS